MRPSDKQLGDIPSTHNDTYLDDIPRTPNDTYLEDIPSMPSDMYLEDSWLSTIRSVTTCWKYQVL